jgi:hypothetical protein
VFRLEGLVRFTLRRAKPLIFLTSVFILSNLIEETQISHNRSVMRDKKLLTFRKYSHISAMILAAAAFLSSGKDAAALTADEVLDNMNADQWFGYVSGVVDGLATARWLQDRPNAEGMQCIYDWYVQRPPAEVLAEIETWFGRHRDQQAGVLLHVLINRECGE